MVLVIYCTERVRRMNVQKKGNWLLFEAPKSWSGLSLEQAFQTKWFVPKKMLHEWRMTKAVAINDKIVSFRTIISPHDRIRIHMKEETIEPTPTPLPLHIVFEDDHVLVVNKRAHIDVHPTQPSQTNTLANAVAFHFQCEGIYSKVRHIHRLDRDTSGVILFAKHALAGAILDQYLAKRTIHRTYIALVHGYVKQKRERSKHRSAVIAIIQQDAAYQKQEIQLSRTMNVSNMTNKSTYHLFVSRLIQDERTKFVST